MTDPNPPKDAAALTDRLTGGTAPVAVPPAASTTTPAAAATPPAEPASTTSTATPGADDGDKDAEIAKWRALSRQNEAAAKRLAAIEDAQKTELQKSNERAAAAEARAAKAESDALKLAISQHTGVPAGLLTGSTKEELEASALAALQFAGKPLPGEPTPPPNFGAGARSTPGAPDPSDPNAYIRALARRGESA